MKKIILHIDFNSYFASVEQQANPFLRGKPIAVSGKGKRSVDVALAHRQKTRYSLDRLQLERTVVTTASYEAKARGVKTAMSSMEAKRISPELIIIPGDPHKYSEITGRFLNILRRHCDAVEQFSTDEAFADVTCAAGDYFGATMLAQIIRSDIQQECGHACTASIGIAPNKLVAKLASESVKPNGLTVVQPYKVEKFLLSRELDDICGIGPRIKERLHRMGIASVRTLRKTPLHKLIFEFKSYGRFLYAAARGMGDDLINEKEEPPKSIGHSYTYPHDLDTDAEIKTNLLALCDRVAWRMRRDNFVATHISVHARYGKGGSVSAGRKFSEPMEDGLELYKNAWYILDCIRDPNRPVRLLGTSAGGLIQTKPPVPLFRKHQKMQNVMHALDKVQTRYGSGAWQRAATLPSKQFKERTSGWHYDHKV